MNKLQQIYKFFRLLPALMPFSMALISCGDNNENEPVDPSTPVPEEVGRTVLVYMLASNNGLGYQEPYDYDMQDIREMCDAAAAGDITDGRLIVFHSSSNGRQILKEVTGQGKIDTLKIYDSDVLPQSAGRMSEVLDDMESLSPARDYGLILWGHGTGWIEDGISGDNAGSEFETYSYGSEHNDRYKMNITTMADVLGGRGFGFIYFDCCYMASVEVMYQLRNAAPKIVAYPTEVLSYGMPYERNVRHFFASTPELAEAAQDTFDFYSSMTNPRYRMCTVSVINTAGLEKLASATRAIYENNSTGVPDGYTPQSYTTSLNRYYCDFGGYIGALTADERLRAAYEEAMAETVELELATDRIWNTLAIREHSGLSTFIMDSDADATWLNYSRLDWFDDVASALIR